LIYLNKQDKPGERVTREDILQDPSLEELTKGRGFFVQECSAKSGEGVWEGIEALAECFK
jgi:hypothetical protein